jgi:hypothetical protein
MLGADKLEYYCLSIYTHVVTLKSPRGCTSSNKEGSLMMTVLLVG